MAKSKEYNVTVNFTTAWDVTVSAKDTQEAMEKAEEKAIEDFAYEFSFLRPSDFTAEAQEP